MKTRATLIGLILAMVASLGMSTPAQAEDQSETFKKLKEQYGGALVTCKFVARANGQEREFERDATLVSKDGMVLISLSLILGRNDAIEQTDFKILIGDDTEGIDAKLIVTDKDTDLAWVKITGKLPEKLTYVDLSKQAELKAGDEVFAVGRMSKFFDHKVMVSSGQVAGKVDKPLDFYVVNDVSVGPGAIIFNKEGKVAGVVTLLIRDELPRPVPLVLTADQVEMSTKDAQELAAEMVEDDKPEENDKPAEESTKPAEEAGEKAEDAAEKAEEAE